jgi:signal transduction histidine kinase
LFAVLLTLGAVLYTIRRRAIEAEQVIRELSSGNLKARIPLTKADEIGTVIFSFNKMADEIEHLIEHLRKTEHARRDLLRELAHDLRTPVASLKSLIETVNERADQLPPEKRRELLDLAMREADYFEGLVDDLLFLGRVQEPKYKTNPETFDLREMVRLELEASQHRHPQVEVQLTGAEVNFEGDPGQIKRLVRNAVENAASFARSLVHVVIESDSHHVEIVVQDDGPGFDPASLASFGQRKYSRAIVNGPSKRISIGLGSVIMKSIVDVYRGELKASNRVDESTGEIQGARVAIRLPLS